jgi:hypothetical protein
MKASRKPGVRVPPIILVLVVALAAAIVWRVSAGRGSHHPTPRADITAATIVDAARYASAPEVERVYRMARAIPNVLDGLFCYCECARNFGHRSLLTCFESDHGAGCDVCLQEAMIAAQMTAQGATLDQVRDRIDTMFAG